MSAEAVTPFVQSSSVCFICLNIHINLKIHHETNLLYILQGSGQL